MTKTKLTNSLTNSSNPILFFDTGPIISLVISRLDWILPLLKKQFGGKFYITPAVHHELIERPLTIRRFEFEALQVLKLVREGVLEVYDQVPMDKVKELQSLANSSFLMENKTIDVLQSGELESVASALKLNAAGVVMDERTLRLFIENSSAMVQLLSKRFQKNITTDTNKIKQFTQQFKTSSFVIIRSIELASLAYRLGYLNSYLPDQKNGKDILLDSIFWTIKLNGCAVTEEEINDLKKFLLK